MITQQGEGFIHGRDIKKDSNNTYFYPKTKDEPYYFIRLPDAMVVFTRDKG